MSIFRLKNLTGTDSVQDWCNYTFPNNVSVDLLDTPELHISMEDLIAIKEGENYENIANLIRTGEWVLNDGDSDISKEDALQLLKYGTPNNVNSKQVYSGNSGVSFNSHNLADEDEWTDGEAKFVVSPTEGRTLLLTGSKILIDENLVTDDPMYFRVYSGDYLIKEDVYEQLDQILLGASSVNTSPKIGDLSGMGCAAMVHIRYNYTEAIPLYSSLDMRLEIGFLHNNAPKSKGSVLTVRVEGVSIPN